MQMLLLPVVVLVLLAGVQLVTLHAQLPIDACVWW